MKGRDAQRQAVTERLADHILEAGLQGASLRPMAAACGTSDRMLLYYFADKNELLTVTVGVIAQRLLVLLNDAFSGVQPYDVLLPRICELMNGAALKPYMRIWLELAALAAGGEEPFRTIAGQLCDGFLSWTTARLKVSREEDRAPKAALLLATVEGLILLKAIGRGNIVRDALKGASPKR
jgi:AcrR family transcriptional regulator